MSSAMGCGRRGLLQPLRQCRIDMGQLGRHQRRQVAQPAAAHPPARPDSGAPGGRCCARTPLAAGEALAPPTGVSCASASVPSSSASCGARPSSSAAQRAPVSVVCPAVPRRPARAAIQAEGGAAVAAIAWEFGSRACGKDSTSAAAGRADVARLPAAARASTTSASAAPPAAARPGTGRAPLHQARPCAAASLMLRVQRLVVRESMLWAGAWRRARRRAYFRAL
jgi:hypothetical protein